MSDTYIPSERFGSFNEEQAQREYEQFHDMSNRIQYATQAAPYLADDPEVLTALAQMPIPEDRLGYLAGAVSAQMRLDGTRQDLERMEPGRARVLFSQLTRTQQEALRSMGYSPPGTDNGGSNPLLEFGGKAIAAGMSGVNTFITEAPVVSQAFDIMLKLENGVKTLYRGIRTDEQATWATLAAIGGGIAAAPFTGGMSLMATAGAIGAAGLAAGTTVAALTNPSDYIDALPDNWNGEAVFSRGAQQRAREVLRDSGLDVLARDIGWEMDAWETVKLFASTPDASSDQAFMASIERVLDRIVEPGDPRRQELAGKLIEVMQIPEFKEAVTLLQHSKVSFGRDLARLANLDPGTRAYDLLSGSMDALFTIALDPTLAAGGAVKWQRARRLGVPLGPGEEAFDTINAIAQRANENPRIGAAYDEIANAVNTDAPHLLWRRVPNAKGMYDDLWNYKRLMEESGRRGDEAKTAYDGVFTRDDIFDWLKQGANFERMLAGHGVKTGHGRLLLPTYGWRVPFTQEIIPVGRVTEGLKAAIDFADDAGNRAHLRRVAREMKERGEQVNAAPYSTVPEHNLSGALRYSASPDDEWRHVRAFVDAVDRIPGINKVMRSTGSMLAAFTEMMPATRSISMVGPQSFEDVQRFVGLGRAIGMTSLERKAWFDTIMQQDNVEHRINAAMSFLETMLEAGVRDTDRGAALTADFVNKVKHRYSLGAADQYLLGERTTSRAIHTYQHTFDLPIPDLKELRQAAEKGLLLKYLYRATDAEFVDVAINKIWKPAVLLRVGFILRAGGEELLSLLSRAGPSMILNEFGARSIAEGRLHSKALQAAATDLDRLLPAQVQAIERMRYAAHVRPLERMFSNWDWAKPANDVLRRWTDFLRRNLEEGFLPGLENRIPASRQLALLGREGSIRRSLLLGIDQDLIRYAEAFGRVHAATIMREVSSHNANIWSGDTIRDKNDFSLRYRDESGELQELGFMVERGRFKVYDRGDPMFDRAAHGGLAQILSDPVEGPAIVSTLSRYAPGSLTDDQIYGALRAYRSVEDWRLRSVLDELLTHNDTRTVNWDSMLRAIHKSDPKLGRTLRASHGMLGAEAADGRAVIETLRRWVRNHYQGNGPLGLTPYGEKLMDQLGVMDMIYDAQLGVGGMERAWLGSFLDHWGRGAETPQLLRTYDELLGELPARLRDRHYDVEVQPLVNNLTYTNRLPDGTVVAHPPREGRTRLWIPQVTAEMYGRMLHELSTQGAQAFVDRVMSLWADAQPHLAGLHIDQADEILRRFLQRMSLEDPTKLARHAAGVAGEGKHGDLIPLAHMGFDDPDLAQRFSQFLNGVLSRNGTELSMAGRMRDNRGYVAILDLDDHLRNYWPTDIDGARRPITHRQWETRVRVEDRTVTEMASVPAPVPRWDDALDDLAIEPVTTRPVGLAGPARANWMDSTLNELDPTKAELHFIGGGRDYADEAQMTAHILEMRDLAAEQGRRLVIVHGGARGADNLAGRIARQNGIDVIVFPAEWDRLGKSAGFVRNEEMALFLNRAREEYGFIAHATAFPGGRGTEHMRRQLATRNLEIVDVQTHTPRVVQQADEIIAPVTRTEQVRTVERVTPRTMQERAIHTWALDREYVTPRTISMADQQIVTLPDGTRQLGADPRDAIAAGVEKQVRDLMNHLGPGTTQLRVVKGQVYRDPNGVHQIRPGTRLNVREEAYDAKGVRLEFDDADAFDLLEPTTGTNLHENWSMIGPLLRDATDTFHGTARLVPDTRDIRNLPDAVRDARAHMAPADGPNAREFRGHWTHVQDLPNPPQVAVGPAMVPIDSPSKWDKVLEFGFEKVISPAIDAIVRRPMAFHMFAEAMRENERALRWGLSKHLFGNPETGELGELHARFSSLLDDPAFQISDEALAADARMAAKILMPDVYDDLVDLEPRQIVSMFYSQWADDIIMRSQLGEQLGAAHEMLDDTVRAERARAWAEAEPGDPLFQDLERVWKHSRGEGRTRLYRQPSGKWSPRKPKDPTGVEYLDVRKSRVSSMLDTLNGPTPSKAFPSRNKIQQTAKKHREQLVRDAEDAVENATRGVRPTLRGEEYNNQTVRRGRQRKHVYSREGYIRARADGGDPPDVFVREMETNLGMEFASIDEGLDYYFRLVDNVIQQKSLSNDLARMAAADELGVEIDIVDAAIDASNADEFRYALGDRPPSGPEYEQALDAVRPWTPDAPPPAAIGPDRQALIAMIEHYLDTGRVHPALAGLPSGVLDAAAKSLRTHDDLVKKFELVNGFSIDEWNIAIEAAERAMAAPRWTVTVRTSENQIEGILDTYTGYLGEHMAKSWDEVQRHLGELPEPMRDLLDENSWKVLSAAHRNKARLQETIEALSAERAIRNSMPYLDSHEIRSQAGEYVRGFFPFMYAEENFLKRWARTLVVAPDALRKAQLIYSGLKSGGVIRTDSQGRDWFVYPGAGLVAETINRTTQAIGFGEVMPSGVVFASETKNMLPGFDVERTGMPSANPLVAMPLAGMSHFFHELRPVQEAFVGQVGVNQGGVSQFVPAAIRRFWDVAGDEESNVKYASAMMSAIAILEHNGHGLPEGATVNQLDDYIRRVRNHTRGILAAQAFVGFIAPGAPSIQFTGDEALSVQNLTGLSHEIPADVFRAEYLELVQELGIEEGTIAYFELNPDHDVHDLMAFTVGQSRSTSGAPLPATHEAVRFADENEGFLQQYPMAAAWLLPQPPADQEEFDEYAYVQQAISGLRQKRTPTEFLEALKYREGSLAYFDARERHEQLMKDAEGDPMRRKQLEDVWQTFKARHLAMHPIFGEQLEGGEARARRARVLDELRVAVEDPGTPQVGHLAAVQDLVRSFDFYKATLANMSESRNAEAQDKTQRLKLTFENLVTEFLLDHPELEPLWLSVLRPEASL